MNTTERKKLSDNLKVKALKYDREIDSTLVGYKCHLSKTQVYSLSKKPEVISTQIPRKRTSSKLAPYIDEIDAWILEQGKLPHKKQEYVNLYYADFKDKHNIAITVDTFKAFIRNRRKALEAYGCHGYTHSLIHTPYEGQADLGTAVYYDKDNILRSGSIVVLSFPHSAMGYCQLVYSKNGESIIGAFINILEHIGSAPRELWCDNEACLVKFSKKLREIRTIVPLFSQFLAYYNIDTRFLRKGRSCGKGSVENKVAYLRTNLLVPVPKINNLSAYNKELLIRCEQLHNKPHYKTGNNILVTFMADLQYWNKNPQIPMQPQSDLRIKVDKFSRVNIRTKFYYLDPKYIRKSVNVNLTADTCTIKLCDTGETVLSVPRLVGVELQSNIDWSVYLPYLAKHPMHMAAHPLMNSFPRDLQYYIIMNPLKDVENLLRNMSEICQKSDLNTSIDVADSCISGKTLTRKDFLKTYGSFSKIKKTAVN